MDAPYVFVRHSPECPHKAKKFHRGCKCSKWLYVPRTRRRISAQTRSWERAEKKAKALASDEPLINPDRQTVQAAVAAYLSDKQLQNLAPVTLRKLRLIFEKQLLDFCAKAAIVYLDELTLAQLERFRAALGNSPRTLRAKQELVRSFFSYCVRHDWLAKNPAVGLSRIKVNGVPTTPFTPEEFNKLLDAVPTMYTSARGLNPGVSNFLRARVRAIVLLLRWSGLRIGDAANLKRSRLSEDGKLLLYTAKTGTPVYVPLPPTVVEELRALPNSNPEYFFCSGHGTVRSVTSNWHSTLARLFKAANLNRRCHVHMLRDTFAVEILLAGVPIDQVSILLGHSSVKITEKHYSPWVRARQEQLELSVQKAWAAVPVGIIDQSAIVPVRVN